MAPTIVTLSGLQGQLLLAGVAFILTSILGGTVSYFYERRRAKTGLRETQREAARVVFEELSRLIDKRLYRMRQVAWQLDRPNADHTIVQTNWSDYRGVLYEWNDSLNRNLALVLRYFGPAVSEEYECGLAEMFAGANDELREHRRLYMGEQSTTPPFLTIGELDGYLQYIDDHIYSLNRHMLSVITERDYAPFAGPRPTCSEGPVGSRKVALLQGFKIKNSASIEGEPTGIDKERR